jgi:lipid-A-disaccharide synthase
VAASAALRVGLLAGEVSGDRLGAGLIREIRRVYPDAVFEGVGGRRMIEAGCRSWLPMDELSVMGLAEVLRHLGRLMEIKRGVTRRFIDHPPDVFVGIDSPDFNLRVETELKAAGIPTVHYVSPSLWAWRPGRARTVARAVDRVLCLLPFEPSFYSDYDVDAVFVGHPMADEIPLHPDRAAARRDLGEPEDGSLVAMLPGSRMTEIRTLALPFAQTAARVAAERPEVRFLIPAATPQLKEPIRAACAAAGVAERVRLVDGRSREVMTAADIVLLASGTAALEAALLKRPMVVAYRMSALSQWVLETFRMVRIERFSLPNLVADEELVPEFLQEAVVPEQMADRLLAELDDPGRQAWLTARFCEIHETLACDADRRAAEAVLGVIGRGIGP